MKSTNESRTCSFVDVFAKSDIAAMCYQCQCQPAQNVDAIEINDTNHVDAKARELAAAALEEMQMGDYLVD